MDFHKMIEETFPLYEDMDDMEVAQTIWRRRGAEILGERLKQQVVEKACNLMQHWILEHDYIDIMELEDYVKQKMEEL